MVTHKIEIERLLYISYLITTDENDRKSDCQSKIVR